MQKIAGKRFRLSSFQIVALGFAGVILAGALLLMLPISSADGIVTPFTDAMFTATTSVCVTGLVVRDTGTYWSEFGHSIILVLIQIGGLGVVTLAATFAMLAGRRIGLFQRTAMQDAVAAPKLGGVVVLTRFIVTATLIVEGIGALIMAPTFIRDFGWGRGIWYAVFHSVSAFCNAGIDLMGVKEPYSSLTSYVADPAINIAVMGLVILGGLGFLAWDDMRSHGLRIKKYSMQTKVILTVTAFLLIVPSIYFFFAEFSHMPLGERIWASLFQAMTPRTAGFNTADLTAISEPGQMLMILLMLIGGAPGSTAGGMKTTTFAVLIACAISVFRKRDSAQFYGRRIGHDVIATAATLAFMYIGLSVGAAVALSMIEGLPILTCLFETGSAIATVGLTLGVTPTLSFASKVILIVLMYIGRVGGLTLIYAATKEKKQMGRLPLDKITVG
jgi:trk system potassium uptake protein TrkH